MKRTTIAPFLLSLRVRPTIGTNLKKLSQSCEVPARSPQHAHQGIALVQGVWSANLPFPDGARVDPDRGGMRKPVTILNVLNPWYVGGIVGSEFIPQLLSGRLHWP